VTQRAYRGRQPSAPMAARDVLGILRALETRGVAVWLDGGWGVDALLGQETREHDDLDLVVELSDAGQVVESLRQLGYELVAGAAPKSFVLVDPVGRQVDVHPVTFDADGGGVYQMDDGKTWVYPAQGFTGRGTVAGEGVRCLSPEVQVRVHAGYQLTDKDYRELWLLRERFGVEPPESIRDQVLARGR
jgi:lincosamide nucleotidyltransferase A/C/D/E